MPNQNISIDVKNMELFKRMLLITKNMYNELPKDRQNHYQNEIDKIINEAGNE